jgi:sec-independent protein translocase protein TatA
MKPYATLGIFNLDGTELILILAAALLLFGGRKLPELAKGSGLGIREFKKATVKTSEGMHVPDDKVDAGPACVKG